MGDGTTRLRVPEHVYSALGYLFPRLLFLNTRYAPQAHWGDIAAALDGFPSDDLRLESPVFWNEWRERWTRQAERYVTQAGGSTTPAGRSRALRGAAAAYHWAEFQYFDDVAEKQRLRGRIRDCFLASVKGSDLEIVHGADPVPYWLLTTPQVRRTNGPWPAMVLSNGLDSVTEIEVLSLAEAYLERGVAAILFEGPGQGLRLGGTPLRLDMEQVVAELVEHLAGEPRIDTGRLGFAGISFGGHIALRVARELGGAFRCVVNVGGGPALNKFGALPRRLKDNFRFTLRAEPGADLQPRFDELALDPGAGPLGTDVLSVHGALDDIFPVEALADLDRAWGARHHLVTHPREAHTSLNLINTWTQEAADWAVARL